MSVLQLNKAFETTEPTILVENKLSVGAHTFRLVVVDNDGLKSDPRDVIVRVVERAGPVGPTPITHEPVGPIPIIR